MGSFSSEIGDISAMS